MVAAVAAILLSGCAGMRTAAEQEVNDPLEPTNRVIFNASIALDKAILRPTAIGYRRVFPGFVRNRLRNFLNNLNSPVIFANDVLQGEVDRAGTTLVRAGVNTTVGLAGFFDVATEFGYLRHSEDFGQTLAIYGVGEGPYLFVPIIGPSNPRDLLGYGVDFLFDPLTFATWPDKTLWEIGRTGTDYVDLRERNIETLDEIESTSLDYYASVRSLYRQSRETEIRNGAPELEDLPNF
jgi:phospholipid-binding lipoprotein MlaA